MEQISVEIMEMFRKEERLLEESHRKTVKQHEEIMAAIEQAKHKRNFKEDL